MVIPFKLTEQWSKKYKQGQRLNEDDQAILQLSRGRKSFTGADAERHVIQQTGGKHSTVGAGSHRTDVRGSHPIHGDLNIEVKTHNHDQQQVRTEVKPDGTRVQQTKGSRRNTNIETNPRAARLIRRSSQRAARSAGGLTPGTTPTTRIDSKGKEQTKPKASATEKGEIKDKRIKLSHRNAPEFLSHDDPIQIHVSHRSGESVIVPMKRKHHKHALQMGVPKGKVVSFESLAMSRKHGNKESPFHARGGRSKGSSINYSVGGDSHKVVEAVRGAGGHVFKSLTHLGKHLKEHGWTLNSGHQN